MAFKISGSKGELRHLPIGRSAHHIEVRPRLTATPLTAFRIRFVTCKTLWMQAQPVSSSYVHIVGCEWKPRIVHDHISVSLRPDDYGGGFEGIFCEGEPEFTTNAELELEITVEASRCWSGYLSFEGWLAEREASAYGRVRASVGGFSA